MSAIPALNQTRLALAKAGAYFEQAMLAMHVKSPIHCICCYQSILNHCSCFGRFWLSLETSFLMPFSDFKRGAVSAIHHNQCFGLRRSPMFSFNFASTLFASCKPQIQSKDCVRSSTASHNCLACVNWPYLLALRSTTTSVLALNQSQPKKRHVRFIRSAVQTRLSNP